MTIAEEEIKRGKKRKEKKKSNRVDGKLGFGQIILKQLGCYCSTQQGMFGI